MKKYHFYSKNFFKDKKISFGIFLIIIFIILIIFVLWLLFDFSGKKYIGTDVGQDFVSDVIEDIQKQEAKDDNPSVDDLKVLINKVAKHVLLPNGQLQVYTVSNADDLKKTNYIFNYAKTGDRVIFGENRIIIYDEEMDKVIDVISKY